MLKKNKIVRRLKGFGAIASLALALSGATSAYAVEVNEELASLLPQRIREAGIVTVATPMQNPPNIFVKDGEPQGEAVDLMRAIEPILGVKFEFSDIQWPGVLPGVQSGNYDMSIGIISYRPDREQIVDLVVYRANKSGILLPANEADTIKVSSDLCGKTVAAVQGSILFQRLETDSEQCKTSGKDAISIRTYPSTGLAIVALKSGNAVAFPASTGELSYGERESNGQLVKHYFDEWEGNPQAAAVSKNNKGLAEAIAGAFKQLHDAGIYQEILEKYGLAENMVAKDQIVVNPGEKK